MATIYNTREIIGSCEIVLKDGYHKLFMPGGKVNIPCITLTQVIDEVGKPPIALIRLFIGFADMCYVKSNKVYMPNGELIPHVFECYVHGEAPLFMADFKCFVSLRNA